MAPRAISCEGTSVLKRRDGLFEAVNSAQRIILILSPVPEVKIGNKRTAEKTEKGS